MSFGRSTAHMFKPKWKNFTVVLKDTQSDKTETIPEVYALNGEQAGFLAFRRTSMPSCFVEKVVEVMSNAS